MIKKEKSDPRYEEAVLWAAGHFLSSYPPTFNGNQILEALRSKEKLHKNIRLWTTLKCDRVEVAEHIEFLARSLVRFGNREQLLDF